MMSWSPKFLDLLLQFTMVRVLKRGFWVKLIWFYLGGKNSCTAYSFERSCCGPDLWRKPWRKDDHQRTDTVVHEILIELEIWNWTQPFTINFFWELLTILDIFEIDGESQIHTCYVKFIVIFLLTEALKRAFLGRKCSVCYLC